MKKAKKEKQANQPEPVPAQIAPIGLGHMPLYSAAQWIATAGHSMHWDDVAREDWDAAYRELCDAIASGVVEIVGEFQGRKKRVPLTLFVDCEVSHVARHEIYDRDEYYLSSVPYIDEERWRDYMHDRLIGRSGRPNWDRLQVRREDIRKLWPTGRALISVNRKVGRPSAEKAYLAEHEARLSRDIALRRIRDEARELSAWAKNARLGTSQVALKTIEGYLRSYRHAERKGRKSKIRG